MTSAVVIRGFGQVGDQQQVGCAEHRGEEDGVQMRALTRASHAQGMEVGRAWAEIHFPGEPDERRVKRRVSGG
jgi:hypothetical protein